MIGERLHFFSKETRGSSKKKMKGARAYSSDETMTEARDFEGFNVNLRSTNDVKSLPHDRGVEASGLGTQTVMIDKERRFPSHTPSSNRERPNSRGICA